MEKDNKKIIVPIIIGIVLLIAIVVGITYAYFQANNTASGTTTLDATTEAVGNVIVTNPTQNLYLKLSSYEMQEDQKGTSYYATATNSEASAVYASEKENNVLANYSISGGTDNTTYNCTFKLNVTKPTDIQSGDMNLEINLLNGATINGGSTLSTDLYNASASYDVSFSATGNVSGNLITGDIRLNNTTDVQDHLIGKTLSTSVSVSDLSCEVAEGLEGAKYNCKVDPNKDEYTFYLLDNNEDGTSDLIMNANINASGEAVIPGVTEDTGGVAWENESAVPEIRGPITAMTYLHNATKSWSNVEPLNFEYNDESYGLITISNGILTRIYTHPDNGEMTDIIGTAAEPFRARMPFYSSDESITEVADKTDVNEFLYDNLPTTPSGTYGYWLLNLKNKNNVEFSGFVTFTTVILTSGYGVRPVITVKL